MTVTEFLTKENEQLVLDAIREAERLTSGEIRLHLEATSKKEAMLRAVDVFKELKMHKTKLRNGVLFYLAVEDKTFAILGDKGVNEKVPADFWEQTKIILLDHFKNEEFAQGISKGILHAGDQLKTHFPRLGKGDLNELSNDISVG